MKSFPIPDEAVYTIGVVTGTIVFFTVRTRRPLATPSETMARAAELLRSIEDRSPRAVDTKNTAGLLAYWRHALATCLAHLDEPEA